MNDLDPTEQITITPDGRAVLRSDGSLTELKRHARRILRVLQEHNGEIVSKQKLIDSAWPDVTVGEDSLYQAIAELRRSFGERGAEIIETVPREGYRLRLPSASPTPGSSRETEMGQTSLSQADAATTGASRVGKSIRWIATAAFVTLLGVAVVVWRLPNNFSEEASDLTSLRPGIVVLPFRDLSPETSLTYFADGMTEDLIVELTRWDEFRVVDRMTSMALPRDGGDIKETASSVDADYALVGSIRRSDGTLRITAQLVDGESGKNLWADRFDETGTDLLKLQDSVIDRIEQTMIGDYSVIRQDEYRKAWRKASVSLTEYDYYLRGHDKFYQLTPASTREAIAIWEEGLASFPDSGLLKVKLGWGFELCIMLACGDPRATHDAALALAREGLRAETVPTAAHRFGLWLQSSAVSHLGDREQVERYVNTMLETYPADTEGMLLVSDDLVRVGAFELARTILDTLQERNWKFRDDGRIQAALGSIDYVDGKCTDAIPKLKAYAIYLEFKLMLAGCLAEDKRVEEARDLLVDVSKTYGVDGTDDLPRWFHNNTELKNRFVTQLAKIDSPFVKPDRK